MMVRLTWKGAPIKVTVTGDVHRVKRARSHRKVSGEHATRYLVGVPLMWGKDPADFMAAIPRTLSSQRP